MGNINFWEEVYMKIGLPFTSNLIDNLMRLDMRKERKRKYNQKPEVKTKRSKMNHEKMKDLLNKQMKDAARGATYRPGIGVEDRIPSSVKVKEKELRKQGAVRCKMFGCHGKNHRTNKSKHCTYHSIIRNSDITIAMENRLRALYPEDYGEFIVFGVCRKLLYIINQDE